METSTSTAPGSKISPVIIVLAVVAVGVVIYLLSRGGTSTSAGQPGVVAGPDDAVQEAVLAAQQVFSTNETQAAIAKSQDAVTALTNYTTANDNLAATVATIKGQTQQAAITANSSVGIAGIQADAATAIAAAQTAAAQASDTASVQIANAQGAASIVNTANNNATSQVDTTTAAAAANQANTDNLIGNFFKSLGLAFA